MKKKTEKNAEYTKPLKGRRAKVNFFTQAEDGKYVYNGKLYIFQEGQRLTAKQAVRFRALCAAALFILAVVCGCLPVEGMKNTFYVILPYVGTLMASVSIVWAVIRMAYWGSELREYVYKATVKQLPVRCVLCAVMAGLALIGEAVFAFVLNSGGENTAVGLIFMALLVFVLILSIFLCQLEKELKWREI